MSYTEMNLDYLKFDVGKDAIPAKLNSVEMTNNKEYYKAVGEIKLNLKFNQNISIMGNRSITVDIGGKDMILNMSGYNKSNEASFTGILPEGIAIGEHNLTIKNNPSMEIINIYNKKLILNEDVKTEINIKVK